MSELCVDASVLVKLVLAGEPHRVSARRLLRDCIVHDIQMIAPAFFDAEVDTVILKRLDDGRLSQADAQRAFAGLDKIAVRVATDPLPRRRTRQLAVRFGQRTAYDCTYAALAQLRGCDFWTADRSFYEAVHAALPFVRYLPSYP